MSPFRIRVRGFHSNNTSLPMLQTDPTINPGTILIFDFGIPLTYGLPAIPANGTSVVAGSTFQNLISGGGVATEGVGTGATNNYALQYWGGNGIRIPQSDRKLFLGAQSRFAAASVNEILVIAWIRFLAYTQAQNNFYGLFDGVGNQIAGNYMQYMWQLSSQTPSVPGGQMNVAVQLCEHRRWDGTSIGSIWRTWANITKVGSPTQTAAALTVMPPGNGQTLTATQGAIGAMGNVNCRNADFVIHRFALHNIQASGGLIPDNIVAADFAANYGRFLP